MCRQGRNGGPNENIHQNRSEEYVGNNSEVINLDLTLGRSTRPKNHSSGISSALNEGARRNLVTGRQEICNNIKANNKGIVSLPLKRNKPFLEGESSSMDAHHVAPCRRGNLEPFHDWERFDEIGKKREGDHVSNSSVLGPPGTLNTITPCAACKLLKRGCDQECPFLPYFSPHEPHKFASVHKVFGARNISKMLMEVPESQRADAANSLVYEAKVRLRDPVYGCMGAISVLQQQVHFLQAELNAVRAAILKYKTQGSLT